MMRRTRLIVVVVALAGAASCSLGEKEAITDRAVRSATVGSISAVTVELAVSIERSAGQNDATLAAGAGLRPITWNGVVDFSTGRSAMLAPAGAAARLVALGEPSDQPLALVVTDGESVSVRRPAGEVVAARPWYRLDTTGEVREVTKPDMTMVLTSRAVSAAVVLTPTFLVSLLSGILPGSVEQVGDTITGRISFDKAAREDDLDDDEIETRQRALQMYAITEDVHDFTLTLADDGSIDRLEYVFTSSPAKQTRLAIAWSMRVTGDAAEIVRPPADGTVRITSFAQARGAVDEWMGAA